ncbi:MAG: CYTH and CHAD domain-containing protein [Alphaproteobacteria bacterium]
MEQELELKLRLPAGHLRRLARQAIVRDSLTGRPRTERLKTVYFDTPDQRLAQQGMALRVRQIGRHRIQTLKVAQPNGTGGEAMQRHAEYSAPVRGHAPDLARLGEEGLPDALKDDGAGDLAEVFRTEVTRRVYPLSIDGSVIELAVDHGEIIAKGRQEPVSEVELELKSGDERSLFEVARRLAERLPLTIEHRTKADRGYALSVGRAPEPRFAGRIDLESDWTVRRGFVAVARNCLKQLYGNEIAVLAGDDAEAVHQLRVAVRRLRAAFTAFGPALTESAVSRFRSDLRWLQRELGPARDWDVFLKETLAPLRQELPSDQGLGALAARASAARVAAHEQARATLRSQRYALFQLRFEHWLGEGESEGTSLLDFARETLARRDRRLKKAAREIAGASHEQLHAIRIAAKKCRYTGEFFRSLFGRKATRKYLRRLRRFQDSLGSLNDAAVAKRLVAGLDIEDRAVEAILSGWFAARIASDIALSRALWEKVAATDRPWDD